MSTRLLLPLLLVALATADPRAAAGPDGDNDLTATVTAMARIGRAYGPVFSPDASRLAVISDLNGAPQLWIAPTAGGWPTLVTTGADPVGGVEWSPAGDWLAFTLLPGGGLNSQIYVVRPDGTGLRRLTDGGKENNWLSRWTWDGRHIVFSSNRRDPAAMDSWMVDVSSGTLTEVARNPGVGSVTSVSEDGRRMVLSRVRSRGDNNLYLIDRERGTDTLLTEHEPPALFDGEIARSGRTVYLSSNRDRDLFAFYRVPLGADGRPGAWELLAERPDAELDGFSVNEQETLASITWNVGGRTELELLDLRTRARTPVRLSSELAGSGRFSQDGTKLALTVSGAVRPPDVWVMDVGTRTLRQVTHSSHAGVDLDDLVRPELVQFTAHDGLSLSGWLYRPKGQRGPGSYVLSFHGGPEGQEVPAFRADYQALLSQGIGVLAPNVRGSSGFGKAFVNLDNGAAAGERGRGTSGTASSTLTQNGIADPKRVGITGGSYGGYMTMAGRYRVPGSVRRRREPLRHRQLQDVLRAERAVDGGDLDNRVWRPRDAGGHAGDPVADPQARDHQGRDDGAARRERHERARWWRPSRSSRTCGRASVPVEYILFPDEGHGWRKVPNRIRSTVAITEFFAKHLAAAPSGSR